MTEKKKGNIIPFPHLLERHLELALDARETEDYETARTHLEQALTIKPDDVSAMFGLVVTYHDLRMFHKAEQLAEQMLTHGLGEYTDVLRLYVISLIQMEKYELVCEILTFFLQDRERSSSIYSEFQDILQTCELLMESRKEQLNEEPLMGRMVEEKLEADPQYVDKLINDLLEGDFDRQLQSIEQMKFISEQKAIDALKEFLIRTEADAVLKTFAISALKGAGVKGKVRIFKFGKQTDLLMSHVPDLNLGLREPERWVADLIAKKTYHEDPIFSSFALQLWVEFFYASYPFLPHMKRVEGWAAALHYATNRMLGRKTTKAGIAGFYGVSSSTLTQCFKALNDRLNLDKRMESDIHNLPPE